MCSLPLRVQVVTIEEEYAARGALQRNSWLFKSAEMQQGCSKLQHVPTLCVHLLRMLLQTCSLTAPRFGRHSTRLVSPIVKPLGSCDADTACLQDTLCVGTPGLQAWQCGFPGASHPFWSRVTIGRSRQHGINATHSLSDGAPGEDA